MGGRHQAGGEVHVVAHDRVFSAGGGAHRPGKGLAQSDADALRDQGSFIFGRRPRPPAGAPALVQRCQFRFHLERRADRPSRVVLVGDRRAKEQQHLGAGPVRVDAADDAAVLEDDSLHGDEIVAQDAGRRPRPKGGG